MNCYFPGYPENGSVIKQKTPHAQEKKVPGRGREGGRGGKIR